LGGHSGTEINQERANAILLLGRVLKKLDDNFPIKIETLGGGMKENVIPRDASALLLVKPAQEESMVQTVEQLEKILKEEYRKSDPGVELIFEKKKMSKNEKEVKVLDHGSAEKVLYLLRNYPNAVISRNVDMPALVETSINPGILALGKNNLRLSGSIRSNVTSRKYDLLDRVRLLAEFLGATVQMSGDYPAWEHKDDSPIRTLLANTYEDLFGKKPQLYTVHAGLECGILSEKIEGLDAISIGPDNFDIHTPQERLSISSTERVWKLIIEFLKRAK
jgi:dipeptidase D